MKRLGKAAFAAATFLLLGAAPPAPLHVYVPGSFTGIMPFLADGIYDAAKAFADEANRAGGIQGRRVEVIKQDDKADVNLAAENAKIALADPNHLVTLGHSFSSVARPIGKLYAKGGKLFMTPYATHVDISKIGGTVFQLCFNDDFQGEALARVAKERMGAKNVLVLTNRSDPYSDSLSQIFLGDLKKRDGKIASRQFDYIDNALDYAKLEAALAGNPPDLIFLPELKVKAVDIVRKLDQLGHGGIPVLGADGWGSEYATLDIFFQGRPTSTSSYYYTYHWHPDVDTPANKRIKALLKERTGKDAYGPTVIALEGLEALKTAIDKSKTVDNVLLAKALRGASFEGATGKVTLTPEGRTERPLVLLKLTRAGLGLDSIVGSGGQ